MSKKYLAYICPVEDITGKEYVYCNITFITGDLDHKAFENVCLKTDIFKFYYFGTALEVVELDDKNQIAGIHDITAEDAKQFGVSIYYILTLNLASFDMLAANDFVYNLKVNKFYNFCRHAVENMLSAMQRATGFTLRVYVINGAVIYIEMDDKPKKDSKYLLSGGYLVNDKAKLRNSSHLKSSSSGKSNEKLKQEDIDRLFSNMDI